jgi:two-component system phosphate regulon sensor histidine kinase PhoR
MTNRAIQRLIIFGLMSIIGIIMMQAYWMLKTWDLKEKELDQKVMIALMRVAKDLEVFSNSLLPDANLINRVASNYYVVNINGNIDANNLKFYLEKRFQELALTSDFEFGIYDCHYNKMMYGEYVTQDPEGIQLTPKEDLPIYNEFTYYFGVRFPERNAYLLGTMRLMMVLSIVLLLTISFFIYAMSIILRQKRMSEMQKDFINNMTHEFKTPISTIKISSGVFMNHPVIKEDKRLLQYAGIINEQNQRLNNQVEKVLQIAKIESDNFELLKEPVDINELIREVIPSLEMRVNDASGQIQLDLHAENAVVAADRLHLTNVLYNLVDNAVKYCKNIPEVRISTENSKGQLIFTVEDKGIGIPKEYQDKVFQKFYRVPTGNVHNVKGFGLGLFYVRNICKAHGWKLSMESEERKGTTFRIEMKL